MSFKSTGRCMAPSWRRLRSPSVPTTSIRLPRKTTSRRGSDARQSKKSAEVFGPPGSNLSNATASTNGAGSMPIRLGAVSYLNTRPLVYGLEQQPDRFTLRFDVPARCAELLHANDVDLGLIPSIEYPGH